jgi:LmbE family N-acetylglucosaminyl deacetylase
LILKIQSKHALFLSAHADDTEFGCGGLIQKLIAAGTKVTSLVFSIAEEAADTSKYPRDIRRHECEAAAKVLGIKDLQILSFPVRTFPSCRQQILQAIVDIRNENDFDLVLTHWLEDIHQDHQVVAVESLRAFKGGESTVMSYEVPLDCQSFSPNVFVPLTESEVERKIEAIWCYQSEVARRNYFSKDMIRSALGYRGPFARTIYAEAFELKILVANVEPY